MSAPVKRVGAGRFAPGMSANPGGRPKGIEEVRSLLQPHIGKYVKSILADMDSPDATTRAAARKEYGDRAWGKPVQSVESNVRTLDIGALYLQAVQAAPIDITPSRADERPAIDDNPTTGDAKW